MSLKKIVVIATTKSQPTVINSEATTWGQLQDSLSSFGDLSKLRAVVKETKTTLELEDAILPVEDFTLFLSPKQIKAGAVDLVSVLQALKVKLDTAIDELVEEVESGDHEACAGDETYTATSSTPNPTATPVAAPRISDEDQAFLNSLKSL